MSMNRTPSTSPRGVLKLKRPMSVAIYDEYSDAAHAVDYLGDRQFPVENLAIVGTDLKSVEKVTGNMTWGKVLGAGFAQGAMWAGMFAVFMWFLQPGISLLTALLIGIVGFGGVGMLLAALQYRMRGGERDYTSTTAIIATHYEVLAEAEYVDRARHLLTGGEPHQMRQLEPRQPSGGISEQRQGVDLGSLPPPYGQQPSPRALDSRSRSRSRGRVRTPSPPSRSRTPPSLRRRSPQPRCPTVSTGVPISRLASVTCRNASGPSALLAPRRTTRRPLRTTGEADDDRRRRTSGSSDSQRQQAAIQLSTSSACRGNWSERISWPVLVITMSSSCVRRRRATLGTNRSVDLK